MSLNSAHAGNGGVLLYSGECIILYSSGTTVEWHGQTAPALQGKKEGKIYLTTHRMIFISAHQNSNDAFKSFSFPFMCLSDVSVEQPVFGANFIKGKVRAQPNGGWVGEAKFKMTFKTGGAIDFCMALLRASKIASQFFKMDAPPPYVPPQGMFQSQPSAPMDSYYGWNPPFAVFPERPAHVWSSETPPPYPGVTAQNVGWNQNVTMNGYYDPNQPHSAYVPPANHYDPPPSYQSSLNAEEKKKL